jgi:hypothetical protein
LCPLDSTKTGLQPVFKRKNYIQSFVFNVNEEIPDVTLLVSHQDITRANFRR